MKAVITEIGPWEQPHDMAQRTEGLTSPRLHQRIEILSPLPHIRPASRERGLRCCRHTSAFTHKHRPAKETLGMGGGWKAENIGPGILISDSNVLVGLWVPSDCLAEGAMVHQSISRVHTACGCAAGAQVTPKRSGELGGAQNATS